MIVAAKGAMSIRGHVQDAVETGKIRFDTRADRTKSVWALDHHHRHAVISSPLAFVFTDAMGSGHCGAQSLAKAGLTVGKFVAWSITRLHS
jgi:hypothetical protein